MVFACCISRGPKNQSCLCFEGTNTLVRNVAGGHVQGQAVYMALTAVLLLLAGGSQCDLAPSTPLYGSVRKVRAFIRARAIYTGPCLITTTARSAFITVHVFVLYCLFLVIWADCSMNSVALVRLCTSSDHLVQVVSMGLRVTA